MSLALFASGNGSNLQALLDAAAADRLPEVALVVANQPCQALERAATAGVPHRLIPHADYPSRAAFDQALLEAVRDSGADLVCLAGFLRLLTPAFLTPLAGRVLNIHPSLLPAFPGMHAQAQAVAAGVRLAGCTVHFVDAGTDTGAIIAQAAVPVLPDDTAERLSARILVQEHRLYPAAAGWVAQGLVRLIDGRAHFAPTLRSSGAVEEALHAPPAAT